MIEVVRRVDASPGDVWRVLADGWSYPVWVVGTSRIRAVSANWPEQGAVLHHSVGAWPFVLNDVTISQLAQPERRLVLRARGRVLGEAVVDIRIGTQGNGCIVHLFEDTVRGPLRHLPPALRQVLIAPRNQESLHRLAYVAEGRHAPGGAAGHEPLPRRLHRASKVQRV